MRTDLLAAVRSIRRARWYAATTVATLAASIALAVTAFAIVDGPLFKPLPYADPDRLFLVRGWWSRTSTPEPRHSATVSIPVFDAWRKALPDARLAAIVIGQGAINLGATPTGRATAASPLLFEVMGTPPLIGGFGLDEPIVPAAPVRPVVISHDLWMREFGGDASAIGREIVNDAGNGFRIVGVMPAGFVIPNPMLNVDQKSEVILAFPDPDQFSPEVVQGVGQGNFLTVLLRLPHSISVAEATTRLTQAMTELSKTWIPSSTFENEPPERQAELRVVSMPFDRVTLQPIREWLTAGTRPVSQAIFWSATVLGVLATINVTGLGVARLRDRWHDFATRRALGARDRDLLRVLAYENGLLAIAGGVVGIAGALVLDSLIPSLVPGSMTVLKTPGIDARVVVFAVSCTVALAALMTCCEAYVVRRSTMRTAAVSRTTTRAAAFPIAAAQAAIGIVLTIAGALVAGSLIRAQTEGFGASIEDTAIIRMSAPPNASVSDIDLLLDTIRRRPEVVAAGGADYPILQGRDYVNNRFRDPNGMPDRSVDNLSVTSGFFAAMGLRASDGRLLSDDEMAADSQTIVVSRTLADRYWPGLDAVGQTLAANNRPFTVIGVVPDVRYRALDVDSQGAIYWSIASARSVGSSSLSNVVIEMRRNDWRTLTDLASSIERDCPRCTIREFQSTSDALAWSLRTRRLYSWVFSLFGSAALLIVWSGILGLVAMSVSRRVREIGVRLALGASRPRVVRQIIGEQMLAIGSGAAVGALVAAWAVQFLDGHLYKTSIYDPLVWATAIGGLIAIAVIAAALPSIRASRIDPATSLRAE